MCWFNIHDYWFKSKHHQHWPGILYINYSSGQQSAAEEVKKIKHKRHIILSCFAHCRAYAYW